jgi:Zn-finger nucleic acid-binding protein
MRLLVACDRCKRQFDATKSGVGKKFRCHCGRVLEVTAPRGHNASVVRCSSCGGPRDANSRACGHCGADFTIHETDLDTVCPGCLARISDRAKYCHHCGQAIAVDNAAGEATKLACPACESSSKLFSRKLGEHGIAASECHHCAGLWLGNEAFDLLKRQALDEITSADALAAVGGAAQTAVSSESTKGPWRYRRCPACDQMMQRRNYGRKSGVIVDICRQHGIWFDADELHRILKWIRAGGLDYARREVQRDELRWEANLESQRRADRAEAEASGEWLSGGGTWQGEWSGGWPRRRGGALLEFLIRAIFSGL